MNTYEAVRACSIALLGGAVLQASGVSAGNGLVVDWRTVRCGETLQDDADAFDTAQLFVALVGPEAALAAVDDVEPAPDASPRAPEITAFCVTVNGGRRRTFSAPGGFQVYVEPHEDDESQAAFTARLAALAEEAAS